MHKITHEYAWQACGSGASAEGVISNTKRKLYATSLLLNFEVYRRIETMSYHSLDGWLGNRMVSLLDAGAEGPGFKSQSRRCRVTVLGKLFTPIVPLLTKQRNW